MGLPLEWLDFECFFCSLPHKELLGFIPRGFTRISVPGSDVKAQGHQSTSKTQLLRCSWAGRSQNSPSHSEELLWLEIFQLMLCSNHHHNFKGNNNKKMSFRVNPKITEKEYQPLGGVRLTPFLRHHCIGKIPKESAWQSIEILLGSGLKSSMVTCK